jgi:hypothetical protein
MNPVNSIEGFAVNPNGINAIVNFAALNSTEGKGRSILAVERNT